MYFGDVRLGQTIEWTFTTRSFTTGVPTTLAGTPSLEAYETGNSTPNTAGITLTVDYSGVTGLNHVSIVASGGNSYATANDISVVIAAGTVGGVSVVGETIGAFSIENRSALMPTTAARTLDVTATGAAGIDWANVENPTTTLNLSGTSTLALEPTTAGRKLDVTTGGNAGIDWANIEAPTTAVNLSGTNIDPDQVVASVTGAVGSVTGAVGSVTGNVGGNVNGNVVGTVASVVGNVAGNVTGTIGGLTAGALADFFTVDSGETYASAVAGSVVKEIADNASISGTIDANLVSINADAQSAIDLKDFADAGYDPATNKVQGVVLVDTLTTYTGNTPQTGDNFARLGAPAGASVSADIAAVKAQTAAIEVDTQDIQSRLPAALVGGRIDASVGAMAADVLTAAALAADAVTEIGTGVWASATRTLTGTQTFNLTGNITGNLSGSVGSVTGSVGGNVTGSVGSVVGDIGGLAANAQSDVRDAVGLASANLDTQLGVILTAVGTRATPADVNAQVLDVLTVDTFAEPTGVPPATTTLALKIGRLHQALRNRVTVTAADGMIFYTDANVALWKKALSDDGTTYDESEGATP